MADRFDVVVAGAGHNSLVAACYLAKAGYRCLVLEGRSVAGGNVVTEELTLPGFRHDSCGTAHVILQDSPMMRNDELGLADYGLEYIHPEIVVHAPFPDGSYLTQFHDLDRTCEEFAKFSKKDAAAYRRMIEEYDAIKPLFDAASYTPIGFGKPINERLAEHPDGKKWLRRTAMSAWEIIRDNFEDDHCRSFMLWMAFQTVVPPEWPMTGRLAYSLVWGRQRWSWCVPKGGSGMFTDVLVRLIEAHGGTALTGKMIESLIVENGRCVGVRCADGSSYRGDKAVLSTIHVKHLVEMAPREAWGEEFLYGVDTYDVGMSGMACYLATDAAPEFETPDGPRAAVSAGTVGWPEEVLALGRAVRDGRPHDEGVPWLLVATPTLVDPDRAPEGHHTVKLLSPQTWELPEGASSWEEHKETVFRRQLEHLRRFIPNLSGEHILTSYVKSPEDIERSNQHMIHGAFHGGDRSYAFSGRNRPVPGFSDHRMPIPGLYQTGGTTSVGGSVTGVPGRNAAIVMLSDLGHDPEEVIAGAGRARAGSH
jgi:phytoene dehydrogenase-like protein